MCYDFRRHARIYYVNVILDTVGITVSLIDDLKELVE